MLPMPSLSVRGEAWIQALKRKDFFMGEGWLTISICSIQL